MKVQCSCGAKSEFDLTPEMSSRPVVFVCPACGLDASEFVGGLVRQQLGHGQAPQGLPIPIVVTRTTPGQTEPALRVAMPPPPQPARSAVRLHVPEPGAPRTAVEASGLGGPCQKHPGEFTIEKCYICAKPICPKCMDLFGYVCSPLCKAKADSHGIEVPVYEGQRSFVEARQWRRVVWMGSSAAAILLVFLGVWFWYAWFGSVPKVKFAVRFPQPAYSGQSLICGKDKDQIIFLHGGTLARHDVKLNKEIWSVDLIDRKKIKLDIDQEMQARQKMIDRANNEGWDNIPKMPSAEKLAEQMERAQAAALSLHVQGQNIWVSSPEKLVRYDWDTGKPLKEFAVQANDFGGLIARGDELLMVDRQSGKPSVTHINLASCESRTEELGAPEAATLASAKTAADKAKHKPTAGLPTGVPGSDLGKPMDPAKVAEQAQNLSYAEKIALPATLANTMSQERTLTELDDSSRRPASDAGDGPGSRFSLLPTKNGFVEFAARLVEPRMAPRSAMKAAPGKSVLQGNLTAGKSMEAANEFLNELQRSRGGDVIQEDMSRYQATVRIPGVAQTWTGEVIGPPSLYPLQTVNVIAANQMLIVLDKSNRKLWQSQLAYNVRSEIDALDEGTALYGQGPCVEHDGSLYVFDEGVLTAFDLATGNVRWRLISVGIVGVFFDNQGMLYVNTTTGSPDSIKYSREIDITRNVVSVVLKVDPRSGKILWSAEPGGMVSYVSGKFIYVVQTHTPEEQDEENPYRVETGFEKGPFMRIQRLNPSNGHPIWEHAEKRAPVDVAFDKNQIRLVFKKEVEVLQFLSF